MQIIWHHCLIKVLDFCQRPLRNVAIDGLSPEISGMSFLRMSFLREIYSGMDEIDRLRKELIFQPKYSPNKSKPYFIPFLWIKFNKTYIMVKLRVLQKKTG